MIHVALALAAGCALVTETVILTLRGNPLAMLTFVVAIGQFGCAAHSSVERKK